jgi:cytochrome c biogenesis protein CcdA
VTSLLLMIVPIALMDSTSMLPLSVMPLAALLGGRRPLLGAGGFLSGMFAVYLAAGVLILFGIDALLEAIEQPLARWYNQPTDLELVLQIVVGLVLVFFGSRIASARQKKRDDSRGSDAMTPWQGFVLGAVLVVVGVPGAFPYFGAIDQILTADLDPSGNLLALLIYNVVFIVPLSSPVVIWLLFPDRSQAIFEALTEWAERFGRRLVVAVLLVVGVLLVADGVAFLAGHPLLPIGDPPPA